MIQAVQVARLKAGPIEFVAAKNVDTDTGEEPKMSFRMTSGEQVLADMSEEAARLFIMQVQQAFALQNADEWTKHPTYLAVEADRQRVAARTTA